MAPDDMQQDVQRDGGNGGSRPVPDPTVLTTEALQREIATLRQLVEQRITGLRDLLEQRIECAADVRVEQIDSINRQLATAEQQRVEQKQDTRQAVDAALTAQKEAVTKTEDGTYKQIEEIKGTIGTSVESLRREFGDLKDRITTVEQQKIGAKETETDFRHNKQASGANLGLAIAGSAIFVALVSVLANVITSQ